MRIKSRIYVHGLLVAPLVLLVACGNQVTMSSNRAKMVEENSSDAKTQPDPEKPTAPGGEDAVDDTDTADALDDGGTPPPVDVTVEREFKVTEQESLTVDYEPDAGLLSQKLTMARKYQPMTKEFDQVARTKVTRLFDQGADGSPMTEQLSQNDLGILDLQVIIDNSGSMDEEQADLANKLPALLTHIGNANWRVNVSTTDGRLATATPPTLLKGCSRKLIQKGSPTAVADFDEAIKAGTNGSGNEEGIHMAVEGLKCNNWVRPDSTIAVLIVSDEDNCSLDGAGCGTNPWNTPSYLLDFLKDPAPAGLGRALGSKARVYGLIKPTEQDCTDASYVGSQYVTAINESKGVVGKICDDYTTVLQTISKNIAATLENKFQLKATPDSGTLVILAGPNFQTLTEQKLGTDYKVLPGNIIEFIKVPAAGYKIEARYKTGNRTTKTFSVADAIPAGRAPVLDTMVVKVGAAEVVKTSPADYSYDAVNKAIVFTDAGKPAPLARISVAFDLDETYLTKFPIDTTAVKSDSLSVVVGGRPATGSLGADGFVTVTPTPGDGKKVAIAFQADLGPILKYDVSLIGKTIRDFKATIMDTTSTVAATYANGVVDIPAGAFVDGQVLLLSYRNEESGKTTFELPLEPISGSFTVDTGRQDCVLGDGITLTGKTVTTDCDFMPGDVIHVTLKFEQPPKSTFVMDGVTNPSAGQWKVRIDGTETTEFTRSGLIIQLNATPAAGSVVKVTFTTKAT